MGPGYSAVEEKVGRNRSGASAVLCRKQVTSNDGRDGMRSAQL
jgi:hypothetical protein